EIDFPYDNTDNPPLAITFARVKAAKHYSVYKETTPGNWSFITDQYTAIPRIEVINNSNHPVKAYSIELRGSDSKRLMLYWPSKPIRPGESTTSARAARVDLSGEPGGYTARVAGVVFADSTPGWGYYPPPPPP